LLLFKNYYLFRFVVWIIKEIITAKLYRFINRFQIAGVRTCQTLYWLISRLIVIDASWCFNVFICEKRNY